MAFWHLSLIFPMNPAEKACMASPALAEGRTVLCLEKRLGMLGRSSLTLGTRHRLTASGNTELDGCKHLTSVYHLRNDLKYSSIHNHFVRQVGEEAWVPFAYEGLATGTVNGLLASVSQAWRVTSCSGCSGTLVSPSLAYRLTLYGRWKDGWMDS